MQTQFVVIFVALLGTVSCYPQGRVVNGTSSSIAKYPFMVSLRSTGGHICGSTIIAPRWILSAAHCVIGEQPSRLSIQFGATDVFESPKNLAKVKRTIVHENYKESQSYANDIALLELFDQLVFNYKTIAPVTLPAQNFEIPQVPEGAPGTLLGWGFSSTGGYFFNVLQEVDLKIYSDAECYARNQGATTSNQICGGVDEGGKGQCSGDSGGPLLHQGNIQLGIVSWGARPCGLLPGVLTKVSHYINWINKNIDTLPRWILSAAHCVIGVPPSRLSIQFASSQIFASSSNVVNVTRTIVHENYTTEQYYQNDIALLELSDRLVFNYKTLAPVTLPAQNFEIPQVPEGAPGTLLGWGLNATGGNVQTTLQEVDLKIYSDAECNARLQGVTSTNQICGGVDEGGKGQCSGDSGGPLLYQGNIQLGIASWSVKPCGAYPYPGVFTTVSHYINWIRNNIDTVI